MVENVSAEIIAGFIVLGLTWAFLPSLILLKPQVVNKCCRFVPGQTPEDFRFYWNHWAIRLTLAWNLLNVGIITWEHMTGTRAHPLFEVTSVTIFLVVLTYIVREMWQARRRKHQTPGNSTGSGVNST